MEQGSPSGQVISRETDVVAAHLYQSGPMTMNCRSLAARPGGGLTAGRHGQ